MKSKKILSGLVVVVVLLSGTTFLYFAGVQRAGPTPALAQKVGDEEPVVPGPCPIGAFCGRWIDNSGGCAEIPCCYPGQTVCGPDAHETYPFPRVGRYLLGKW